MEDTTFSDILRYLKMPQNLDLETIVDTAIVKSREDGKMNAVSAFRLASKMTALGRADLHDKILMSVPTEYLTEWRVRKNYKRIPVGASFSASMSQYRAFTNAVSQSIGIKRNRRLFQKTSGRKFALTNGFKVAEQYQVGERIENISVKPGTILKPMHDSGSKGVFVFKADGRIINLKTKQEYSSFDQVKDEVKRQIDSGYLLSKRFLTEELLEGHDGGVPNDLKFYTFYGEIGLALEGCRLGNEDKHCFYVDGKEKISGKYPDALFSGAGYPDNWNKIASDLSKLVPLPFLRIDFFMTNKGLYVGEFTSAPGGYEKFNLEFDRMLGERFINAQARLHTDMLNGKIFVEYQKFLDSFETAGEEE
ncbi:ATP-grasp fold amidoligase family protein [Paracoccus sp. (in: a-proteobacteria)]|uniref:ATP-grasp fold amidoligase family protein n=1 Tax=Paracoccus sp. TaxID=267 RepID=UPI0026DFF568|nr:ATP-grasp fold amidoligase family protein [Paracoccus sp. (in: a-proteobacteria)]MDO5647577.1 ATP-grasp fold amidoligase family protein [Paracoccus sp. (in: a-proteobacteria)]